MDELLDLVRDVLLWAKPTKAPVILKEPEILKVALLVKEEPVQPIASTPEVLAAVAAEPKIEAVSPLKKIKEALEKAYPHMKFLPQLPSDDIALKVKERFRQVKRVFLVHKESAHPLLIDLEKAINERLAPCLLCQPGQLGEPLIVILQEGDEALAQEWKNAKTVIIPKASALEKNPTLKTQCWKLLQKHVRLHSS